MMYYLLKNIETGQFLKGTDKNYLKNAPPKLYTKGTANQVAAYYKSQYKIELKIIPVNLVEQPPI